MEDYIYKLKNLYTVLPIPIRAALGFLYNKVPPSIRYGKNYTDMYDRLLSEEFYSTARIHEIQAEALKFLVRYCFEKVPYYSRVFAEYEINVKQIQTIEDFKKNIPFTLKSDIQSNSEAFIPSSIDRNQLILANTGGSTGIPLQLYYQKHLTRSYEHAFFHNLWKRVDFEYGDPVVFLRGFSIPQSNHYWYFDRTKNRLVMSSYHLNTKTIPLYINRIKSFKPKFFHVYPAALTIIAKYMDNHSISLPFNSKAILAGSETIFPHQRKLLEKIFNCRLFSWYGQGEMVALGGECEHSREYHLYPQYGFAELEKVSGADSFEIVGTSFVNPAMPLLRYKTGDIAEPSENRPCECGRNHYRIKSVLGRKQELIVTRDNSIVTLTALVFGLHHEAFKNIRRLQIEQQIPGHITVRIDKMDSFTRKDEIEIAKNMSAAVSGDLEIDFEYSHELSLTPMGKHKLLIQKLDIQNYF